MTEQNAGSIAVELALKASTFETQMKRAAASVRGIEDEFRVSKAEAEAAGRKFDELGAQSEATGKKLALQEASCQKYRDRLAELKDGLVTTAKGQQELAVKLDAAKKAHADSAEALKAHAKAGDLDEAAMKALADETERLKKESDDLKAAYDAGNRELVRMQGKIGTTEQAYNKLRIETAKTREEHDKLTSSLEAARKKLAKTSEATGKIGNALTLGLTAPVIAMGTAAATSAVKWEDAFAGVRKTVDATEEGYAKLQKQIVAMSEEIPVSKEEIAGIAAGAGQLGVAEKGVAKFTRVMADLGVSTDLSGEAAATMFAQYANITRMDLSNVDRLGSMIVDLGNNTATTESEIGEMMQRLAGAGTIVGLTDAQIAGISATLSSLGIEAEAGGTAMSKALSQIDSAVISGGGKLNAYAKIAGMSAKEFSAAWKGDPVAALQLFTNGLSKISAAGGDVNAALKTVGINEVRMTDMMKRLSTSGDMLTKTVSRANTAWTDNTALTKEAAERYGTTASQIQIAQNKLSNMATSFGNAFLPAINEGLDAVGGLAQKFASLDEGVRNNIIFGAGAAALAGPLMKAISGVTGGISTLLKGVQSIRSIGGIGGLFAAIPAAGPVAIGLAATAVGKMALNWLDANSAMKKYENDWHNLDFGLKDEATAEIQAEIDKAVSATNRVIEIRAEIAADQQNIEDMFSGFMADGKLKSGEKSKLTKAINAYTDSGIKEAKANTEAKIAEYNEIWDSLGMSNEQKTAGEAAIREKGDGYITDLKAYRAEALTLINGLSSGEIAATQENYDRLNELLTLIGDIKAEIAAASEGLDAYTNKALVERIASGNAGAGDVEAAVNMTVSIKNEKIDQIKAECNKAVGEWKKIVDDNVSPPKTKMEAQAKIDLKFDERDAEIAVVNQQANELLNAMSEGFVPDETAVKDFVDKLNVLSMLERYYGSEDMTTAAQEIGPKIAEAAKEVFPEMSQDEIDMIAAGMFVGTNIPAAIQQAFQDSIDNTAQSGELDPLVKYLNQIGGNLTADDMAGLNDNLKAAVALVDLQSTGGTISENLMNGLKLGLTDNQALADEAVKTSGDGLVETMKAALGIKSPSKEFKDIGYWSMMGLQQGFMDNRNLALAPLKLMILNDLPPIGAGMVDALISGVSSRRQALIDEVVGAVRAAISSAQDEADRNPISIPAQLDTSGISLRKLSKELARL